MTKLTISAIGTMVLSLLGIDKFARDEKNQVVLTAEEIAKIDANYGEKFRTKLLEIENKGVEASADDGKELYAVMKEHFGEELQKQLFAEAEKNKALALEKTKLENEKVELEKTLASKDQALKLLAAKDEELPPPTGGSTGFFGKRVKFEKGDTIMKVNMTASHYAAIRQAAERGFPILAEGSNIDVADLKREFGSYLGQNGNQIQIDLYSQLLGGFTSASEFRTQLAENEYRAGEALVTSVMQSFIPEWTPQGGIKFNPIRIRNYRHKINVAIKPASVLDSYASFLYEEGLSPEQHPIVKYALENLIFPQLLRDIENRAFFKGKFVETLIDENKKVTQGGKPEDSMDGIETILVDNKTNAESGIHYFNNAKTLAELKALQPEEFLDYIADFVDFVSEFYPIEKIHCSLDVYKLYKRNFKLVWGAGAGIEDPNFGKDVIDFSNKVLKPLQGMYKSPILFATPEENKLKLKWKKEAPFVISNVVETAYDVLIVGEFSLSGGFAVGNAVFAAVPDGYNPKAVISGVWGDKDSYQVPRVQENAVINILSSEASETQSVAEGVAIENIIYKFKGASASVAWTGTAADTAPAGLTVDIADNMVIISGTPTAEGNYGYTLTVAGALGAASATVVGTIEVETGA
ncbi:MAG: Ig domain-containing protein [Prevotellaceae bacterium]|jgi:hypothetical protein|nr:Ig domain-containing protein [Prevotellaceae bacterium]